MTEKPMPTPMKIDFVSDLMCPWCVIGLKALEQALANTRDVVTADVHVQPFELNPQMPAEGQDIIEHITQKYGSTPEQTERNREAIRARGAELGFTFDMQKRQRIYNTFDAHRLLHWAESEGQQRELKQALFDAYFTAGRDLSDHAVLIDVAGKVGLDRERAQAILSSDEFARETREREQFYVQHGIQAVPSVIINDRHLIQGGQPVETFERILRQLADEISRAA
jgi:predicted DsbA family dithiol-disulfide isomerase